MQRTLGLSVASALATSLAAGLLGAPASVGAGPADRPRLVKDVNPGPASSFSEPSARLGDVLVFVGTDTTAGAEPWVTDGTRAGTRRLADTVPGPTGGTRRTGAFAVLGDRAFFLVRTASGDALWSTDGTRAGTTAVTALGTAETPTRARELTAAGGRLFFVATAADTGRELWTSDGTAAGTTVVADVRPGAAGAGPEELTSWNGGVVFTHHDGTHGREPWVSDGTPDGTRQLADALPGPEGSLARVTGAGYTAVDDRLYFRARGPGVGVELFRTTRDGSGAVLFEDLVPGAGDSFPEGFTRVGDRMYFRASVADPGGERVLVAGRRPGSARVVAGVSPRLNPVPADFTAFRGRLWFTTTVDLRHTRLWAARGDRARQVRALPLSRGVQEIGVVAKVGHRLAVSRALPGATPELFLTRGTRTTTRELPFDARRVDSEFFDVGRLPGLWLFTGETRAHGYELRVSRLRR